MYHHVKKLMYTVRVDEPDPRFGNMLLEQFGGAGYQSPRAAYVPKLRTSSDGVLRERPTSRPYMLRAFLGPLAE